MSNATHPAIEDFRHHVKALQGVYYRLDNGYVTGRNANLTAQTIEHHYSRAAALMAAACQDDTNPLPEYLDAHQRLAASWNRLERRYHRLPA